MKRESSSNKPMDNLCGGAEKWGMEFNIKNAMPCTWVSTIRARDIQ
jgi:hypothetical protein